MRPLGLVTITKFLLKTDTLRESIHSLAPRHGSANDESQSPQVSSYEPFFEPARTNANEDVPISAWETELNNGRERWTDEVTSTSNNEPNAKRENRPPERCRTDHEYVIANELK